jgi:hypothetical protein
MNPNYYPVASEWTTRLKEYDETISNSAPILSDLISKMMFEPVLEFELGTEIPAIPDHFFKKKGIYFFELKVEELNVEAHIWFTVYFPSGPTSMEWPADLCTTVCVPLGFTMMDGAPSCPPIAMECVPSGFTITVWAFARNTVVASMVVSKNLIIPETTKRILTAVLKWQQGEPV